MPPEQSFPSFIDQQRDIFLRSVPTQEVDTQVPAHMRYPRVWEFLGKPNPRLLLDYLRKVHEAEDRFSSAVMHMKWYEVGFHGLPLTNATEILSNLTLSSIQANFYSEEYPGNEDPHAHSRNAKVVFYAHPDSRQTIIQSNLLPQGTLPVTDFPTREVPIVVNCLTSRGTGQSPIYNPVVVGEGYVAQVVTTAKGPLSEEIFNSIGVHNFSYEDPGVAVSIHVKSPRESQSLNTLDGLTHYKGLTLKQAEHVESVAPYTGAPRTLILPTRNFQPEAFCGLLD